MELKDTKCSGCNTLRKKSDFIYKEKVNKTCSKCMETRKAKARQYYKQYYEQNKTELSEKHKQYNEQNKEKISGYIKQYYEQNKEKITDYTKQYNEQNKEQIAEHKKQHYEQNKEENPLKLKIQQMIINSKVNDKKHNRIYEEADYIDYDFLLGLWETQTGLCGYDQCKCEMVLTFNHQSRNPQQISIQRLDNNISHIKSNVILSCFECNVIKHLETKC
tara:strand:+ start:81 stop:737 length:657 start_codon:yes stop_codon:yes gene_type:complete